MTASPLLDTDTIALIVRVHPHWTLSQLSEAIGPELLERVRLADLWQADITLRRMAAEQLTDREFDACVLRTLREAGTKVAAAHLRERVGGPRWKLQASLGRLFDAGLVEREGTTSATRYWFVGLDDV
jgi:uncharacterized membrane protein